MKNQAMVTTRQYDPYYGFNVIKQGTMVYIQDNNNGLSVILDLNNTILGTISTSSLNEYFN
jgi:hypothetical protein